MPVALLLCRAMADGGMRELLVGVSRSFYLSLRLLPGKMRGAASLAYLLARTSDTLADTAGAPAEARLLCLDWFDKAVAGEEPAPRWPLPVLNSIENPRERALMECSGELIVRLERIRDEEAGLVRRVVRTIISGQRLDLERFAGADAWNPLALADADELEDYTWRVAGCVGEFWTRLGFLTLGDGFASVDRENLAETGALFGKGLQLVNILRDLPADLREGRCYLPLDDPRDPDALLRERAPWIARAREGVAAGRSYASAMRSRRLRAAAALPAAIAGDTLDRIERADWETLSAGVKTPRRKVYGALLRGLLGSA